MSGMRLCEKSGIDLSPSVKIANWNLERVNPSQGRSLVMSEYFAAIDADVWFLTETHRHIEPSKEFFSCFSGTPDRASREGERWVGIWSRWLIERLDSYTSDSARCAVGRIADSPFGELILFGTVLPWTNEWRGIPGADGQAFEAALALQKGDWLRLIQHFPNATLIVAGDFNQDLAAWHYYGSRKKRALLESALAECNLIALTSGLDDPIARDSPPMACIDHICISASSDWVLDSTTRWPDVPKPEASLSDHFGVSVEVSSA